VQALDRVGDGNQFPYLFKDTFLSLESTIMFTFSLSYTLSLAL